MVLFFTHIVFVVNHTFNATPTGEAATVLQSQSLIKSTLGPVGFVFNRQQF